MNPGWLFMLETIQLNLEISEYVSIILSFHGMKSTPRVFVYTGVEELKVPRLSDDRDGRMRSPLKSLVFTFWKLSSSGFDILWCLVSACNAKDGELTRLASVTVRDRWMMNKERWTRKQSETLSFFRNWIQCHSVRTSDWFGWYVNDVYKLLMMVNSTLSWLASSFKLPKNWKRK